MPCYRPIQGWRSKTLNETGRRSIVFKKQDAYEPLLTSPLEIPCGRCIGCKLERSRQWAIRCVHEASLHDENCVLTLTYDDDHLPADGSVDVTEFQRFMKRLRKHFTGQKIRFLHCGEYGDEGGRPHYHACIFGINFDDKKFHKKSAKGDRLYTSETLQKLWPFGFCLIGSLTFESAAYVARYITKKITGDKAEEHYQGRKPEYITMSRRPGLAKGWLEKYKTDVYPDDFVVINGKKIGVPKFYDNQLEEEELKQYENKRIYKAYEQKENNTYSRLYVREQIHEKRAQLLKRSFEND